MVLKCNSDILISAIKSCSELITQLTNQLDVQPDANGDHTLTSAGTVALWSCVRCLVGCITRTPCTHSDSAQVLKVCKRMLQCCTRVLSHAASHTLEEATQTAAHSVSSATTQTLSIVLEASTQTVASNMLDAAASSSSKSDTVAEKNREFLMRSESSSSDSESHCDHVRDDDNNELFDILINPKTTIQSKPSTEDAKCTDVAKCTEVPKYSDVICCAPCSVVLCRLDETLMSELNSRGIISFSNDSKKSQCHSELSRLLNFKSLINPPKSFTNHKQSKSCCKKSAELQREKIIVENSVDDNNFDTQTDSSDNISKFVAKAKYFRHADRNFLSMLSDEDNASTSDGVLKKRKRKHRNTKTKLKSRKSITTDKMLSGDFNDCPDNSICGNMFSSDSDPFVSSDSIHKRIKRKRIDRCILKLLNFKPESSGQVSSNSSTDYDGSPEDNDPIKEAASVACTASISEQEAADLTTVFDAPSSRAAIVSDSDSEHYFDKMHKKKSARKTIVGSSDDNSAASELHHIDSDTDCSPKSDEDETLSLSSSDSNVECIDLADASDSSEVFQSPVKGGRKNIRTIKEANLFTKKASQVETDREKRISEKQNFYNKLFDVNKQLSVASEVQRVILDFNTESKQVLVEVHSNFVSHLKPHQIEGIKFMFNCIIESVDRVLAERSVSPGQASVESRGCILSHCMGLGKTLQVIVFLHTILKNKFLESHFTTALIICPKNTVSNWLKELRSWIRKCHMESLEIYDVSSCKSNHERSFKLKEWGTDGGVCVISYDMFKRLTFIKSKASSQQVSDFKHTLIDPGADIVVCDEGHLIKNPKTAIFKSINFIRTTRRVILTGTPLQNNLREYHTMIEFVKPKLLGTESEFSNRFIRPIENGSTLDALPSDVRLMKRRSHVLFKMLKSFVQRCDFNVLTPFLPAKQEFIVMIKPQQLQRTLYEYYLKNFCSDSITGKRVISDFQTFLRICTHPRCLRMKSEKSQLVDALKQEKLDMKKFVVESSESGSDCNNNQNDAAEVKEPDWWEDHLSDDMDLSCIHLSGKMTFLFELICKCENIGDKLLVFSQSLFTLDLIEEHLSRLHNDMASSRSNSTTDKHKYYVYFGTWKLGYDYFRLDGSTSEHDRMLMCRKFNSPSNERARLLLISTRAGGLGINLVGANRVVLCDASWNPSNDMQAVFRVFRFGQIKPCYIYRLLMLGTMEEKIYDRQISKLSLAGRVVDEHQVARHFSQHDVLELYKFEPDKKRLTGLTVPKDDIMLMELLQDSDSFIASIHGHDSLLENLENEELNEEEQRAAWEEYENDKRGLPNNRIYEVSDVIPLAEGVTIDKRTLCEMMRRDNPDANDHEIRLMLPKAIQTLRAAYFKKLLDQQTMARATNQLSSLNDYAAYLGFNYNQFRPRHVAPPTRFQPNQRFI